MHVLLNTKEILTILTYFRDFLEKSTRITRTPTDINALINTFAKAWFPLHDKCHDYDTKTKRL